jgi:hypothetical protein
LETDINRNVMAQARLTVRQKGRGGKDPKTPETNGKDGKAGIHSRKGITMLFLDGDDEFLDYFESVGTRGSGLILSRARGWGGEGNKSGGIEDNECGYGYVTACFGPEYGKG